MPTWLVQLSGDKYDLEDLPAWFPTSEARVIEASDGYYLESSLFEFVEDSSEVHRLAEGLREHILGAARLMRPDFQSLGVGAVIRQYEDGRRDAFVMGSATLTLQSAKLKATGTVGSGNTTSQLPRPTQWISLATRDVKVAQALRLWGTGPIDWVNLYRVFEVIEGDIGGAIYRNKWTTHTEAVRFTRTANSVAVLGDAARHAKPNVLAPAKPMSLGEARNFVRHLLEQWIDSKLT